MPEFYLTRMGQKFFNADIPRLIRSLESIAKHLEKADKVPDLLAALDRLLKCPALNVDDLEYEDGEAFEQAWQAVERVKGAKP